MLKVAIGGASGHMGQMLINGIAESQDLELVGAFCHKEELNGQPVEKAPSVSFCSDIQQLKECGAQVFIDFSRPDGTIVALPICKELGIPVVIGTTSFTPEQREVIAQTAHFIPVVLGANMSTGVNVAMNILSKMARALPDYDCEIVEMHHSRKVDAPSGTAIEMGRVVAEARGEKFEDVAVLAREGHTGPRKKGSIGFAALRGGDVVGDHRVIFAGKGERIEIAHLSSSREGYAQGALTAARFLQGKEPRLYSMFDVLGLK